MVWGPYESNFFVFLGFGFFGFGLGASDESIFFVVFDFVFSLVLVWGSLMRQFAFFFVLVWGSLMNQFSLFFVLALVWLGVVWFGFRLPLLGKQCADQMHC